MRNCTSRFCSLILHVWCPAFPYTLRQNSILIPKKFNLNFRAKNELSYTQIRKFWRENYKVLIFGAKNHYFVTVCFKSSACFVNSFLKACQAGQIQKPIELFAHCYIAKWQKKVSQHARTASSRAVVYTKCRINDASFWPRSGGAIWCDRIKSLKSNISICVKAPRAHFRQVCERKHGLKRVQGKI